MAIKKLNIKKLAPILSTKLKSCENFVYNKIIYLVVAVYYRKQQVTNGPDESRAGQ